MSESHRDHDKSSNTSSSQNHRNSKDEINSHPHHHHRKRSQNDLENIDAKVYVGNIPTDKVTDEELLDFFKPFGKVSDIRVFKDHIFVQYNRNDDAKKLIKEAQTPLTLKGNKLEILPARDVRSTSTKSSSTDRSSKRRSHERISHGQSSNYEPTRKKFSTYDRTNFNSSIEMNGRMYNSLSRSDSRRSSTDHQLPYTILTGPKNLDDLIDCQIIIVNIRQRGYAEEIESRLCSHGLITSIILLREDYTLTDAIENAARLQCLYGIIAMPMHEERRTASFHILYGQTEEHRNLTLEDGIHIIITNFLSYKERLHNEQINSSYRINNDTIIYPESEYNHSQDEIIPPILTLNDKLPLSMLLCLLADGRQLTLEEIDRVLVYLLEKKAKMLTLPPGTLPPLPAQYATITTFNQQTNIVSDTRPLLTSNPSPGKTSSTSTEVSSTIAEQIRQILSTNIKTDSTTTTTTSLEKLPDIVKVENSTIPQTKNNVQDQQSKIQSSFSYPKTEAVPIVVPPFNYTSSSSSISTTGSVAPSFTTTNFSSFNSAIKSTVANFVSQPSQYFYPIPAQTVYPSSLNSTATVDTTAAFLQAYSQFNVQPTPTSSIINQQLNTQQQQIRK